MTTAVTARCQCGQSWQVAPRADGTLPATARCAIGSGGCGRPVKVPRAAAPAAVPATAWDPPSEPRKHYLCAEPCPHCGQPRVHAEPRGTRRVCLACQTRVTPPGVLAPYERGAEVTRAAKSQRERDLEALTLAGRKGVMLGQLHGVAADERLDAAAVLEVEWFAEQVKAAETGARLDELAALYAEAGIGPRRWWQARPAPLTAGYPGEDDDGVVDGYVVYDDDEDRGDEPAPLPAGRAAIAAPPRRATWADAFAAHAWRLAPGRSDEACQLTEHDGQRCAEQIGGHTPVTDGLTRDGSVCSGHYYALAETIISINRARGIT